MARLNAPRRTDCADAWQPFSVALSGLADLFSGAIFPRNLLLQVDLNGSSRRALLAMVIGIAWCWLFLAAGLAGVVGVHSGVSPAAAIRFSIAVFAPPYLAIGAAAGFVSAAGVGFVETSVLRFRGLRAWIRLAGYWIPVVTFWSTAPIGILAAVDPESAVRLGWCGATLSAAGALGVCWGTLRRFGLTTRSVPILIIAHVVAGATGAILLLVRPSPEPPGWIYFVSGF